MGLTVNGVSDFASAALNENQRQINNFGILAWQKRVGDFDFQVAGFSRYSSSYFSPGDPTGDLLFNGIAQTAYRQSWASGVQGDGSWRASPEHTVRSGFFIQRERSPFSTTSNVLPVDENGVQTDRPADLDLRFRQQDRMALQLLPAGRMENHSVGHDQFRRPLRPVRRIRQRAAVEPARQCGVAADRYDDIDRRLLALFRAAAL